jgi:hypothetical protein
MNRFVLAVAVTATATLAPALAHAQRNWRVDNCVKRYEHTVPDPARFRGNVRDLARRVEEARRALQRAVECANALSDADLRAGQAQLQRLDREMRARLAEAERALAEMRASSASLEAAFKALQTRVQDQAMTRVQHEALTAEIAGFEEASAGAGLQFDVRWLRYQMSLRQRDLDKAEFRARADAFAATSVVARMPELGPDDLHDLAKVEAAFAAARPEDFVRVKAYDHTWDRFTSRYQPTPRHGQDALTRMSPDQYRSARIWSVVAPYADADGQRDVPLAPDQPALVWYADQGDLITIDVDAQIHRTPVIAGGRNQPDELAFERGLAAKARWPGTKMDTGYLSTGDLQVLEQAGQVKAGTLAQLQKAATAIDRCAARIWDGARKQFSAIEAANVTERTRENRYQQLYDTLWRQAERACKKEVRAFESAYRKAADARTAARRKTAARLRAIVGALAE